MTISEQDVFTRQQLMALYGVGRTAFKDRVDALGVVPQRLDGRLLFTLEQKLRLDALDEHLQIKGNRLEQFLSREAGQLDEFKSPTTPANLDTPPGHTPAAEPSTPIVLARVVRLRALLEAVRYDLPLTSSEVADAIGCCCPTRLLCFERRGFVFSRVGREGREYLWRVARAAGYIVQPAEPERELISQGNGRH